MSKNENVRIAPADGKLGVLIPGIGAVSTTFMAGVHAIRQGLAEPVGSLTQLSTIRLGKRTDARTPRIKDFVPLAPLESLEVGCWDIFEDNAYEAAVKTDLSCCACLTAKGLVFVDPIPLQKAADAAPALTTRTGSFGARSGRM